MARLLVLDGLAWVFEKLLNYWGSPTQLSLAVRGKRPECLQIDRKTIVTEITSRYDQGMQKNHVQCILKQMGYSSLEDHMVSHYCQLKTKYD